MANLLLQPANVIAALVGAVGLGLMVWSLLGGRKVGRSRRVAERLRRLQGGEEGRFTGFADTPLLDRLFRTTVEEAGKGLAAAAGDIERDAALLRQAGYPPPFRTLGDFYGWKVVLAIVSLAAGLVSAAMFGESYMAFVALGLGLLGLYYPDIYLRNRAQRRQELFRTSLAFSLGHIGMIVEAGETPEEAIRHVAVNGRGLFAQKMREVVADLNLGVSLIEALEKLKGEFPVEEYGQFVNAVDLNYRLGTPLGTTLAQQAENILSDLEAELLGKGLRAIIPMTAGMGLAVAGLLALIGAPLVSQFFGW
jgi:Flp pilus assembly protein TadB